MKRFGIRGMREHQLAAIMLVFMFCLTTFAPITSASSSNLNGDNSVSSSDANATRPYVQPPYVEHIGGTAGKHHKPLAAQPQWSVVPNTTSVAMRPPPIIDAPVSGGSAGSKAHALTVANVGQVAEHKIGFWDIVHLIILPYTASFEVAFNVMPSVTDWIMDLVSPDSDVMKASAMDVHTWDGGGADVFAGTSANWVSDIHPVAGDSVVWNAGALPCTWNLTITLDAFSMNAGYTGTVTQAAVWGTTGSVTLSSGIYAPNGNTITCGGNWIESGTFVRNSGLALTMSTDATQLTTANNQNVFVVLTLNGNITVSSSYGPVRFYTLAVASNKIITVLTGAVLYWYASGGTFVNNGRINTQGTSSVQLWAAVINMDPTLGIIQNLLVTIKADSVVNRICNLTANTQITGTLTVSSSTAYSITLAHHSNYQLNVSGAVTLGALATMTQGTGTWQFNSSYTQNGASSLFTQGGALNFASFSISDGTFTGNPAYLLTDSGGFTQTGGTITGGTINLVMTGAGTTITTSIVFMGLRISANNIILIGSPTIDEAGGFFLTIDGGASLSITNGCTLTVKIPATLTNSGSIIGLGTLAIKLNYIDGSITFGTVAAPTIIYARSFATANRVLTLAGAASFGSTLNVYSEHATFTMTLDLSGTNYALSAVGITIGVRGILNGRGSIIIDSGNWDSSAGSFIYDTSTLNMTGAAKTIKTVSAGTFYNINVSGTASTITNSFTVSHSLTVTSTGTLSVGTGLSVTFTTAGAGSWTNRGMINGLGTLNIDYTTANTAITFGMVNTATVIKALAGADADRTCSLGANTAFGSSLTISSAHATFTMTLDLSASNYALTAVGITISTRGVINGRASTVTTTTSWNALNGAFTYGTSTVVMTGTGDIYMGAAQSFYNLTKSGAGTTVLMQTDITVLNNMSALSGTFRGVDLYSLNNKILYVYGDVIGVGLGTQHQTRLVVRGEGKNIFGTSEARLSEIRFEANVTFGSVHSYRIYVAAGKTVSITNFQNFRYFYTAFSYFTNDGTIIWLGSPSYGIFEYGMFEYNPAVPFVWGNVTGFSAMIIQKSGAFGAMVLTLGQSINAPLASLSISQSGTYGLTFNGAGFTVNVSALGLTGLTTVNQGSGQWNITLYAINMYANCVFNQGGLVITNGLKIWGASGSYIATSVTTNYGEWNTSVGIFTAGAGTVIMAGVAQPIKLVAGQSFYNLNITGTIDLLSDIVVANVLTVSGGTLDLSASNYALTAAEITIGAGGSINGRGSVITDSGNWDSSAGTFTYGTSNLIMSGSSKTLKMVGGQSLYDLNVTGATSLLSSIAILHNFTMASTLSLGVYTLTNTGGWTYCTTNFAFTTAGTFIAGTSITVSGNWDTSTITWVPGTSYLNMTGTVKTLKTGIGQTLYELRIAGSTTTASSTNITHSLITYTAKSLTIGVGFYVDLNCSAGGTYSNLGSIVGAGTMYYSFNTADATITFGTVDALAVIRAYADATGNRICTLGAAVAFGSDLTVASAHPIWAITLDDGANQLLGVWGATTLGSEGIMVQGTGHWTFWGTFTENSATALFEAGHTINFLNGVTISAGTFNANNAYLLIGHNWDSSSGWFNAMNSVANMSMVGAVAHTAYNYPFNTLNILVGGSVQANPVLHAKNLTVQFGATLIVLVNGTTVFTFLDLNGTISSAGWFLNITASNTNVGYLNGSWDGNIALNGTALFYSVYTRCPMVGSLYTNRTMYLSVNSTSGSIRVTPTSAWTNITLRYINITFVAIGALVAEWWAGTNTTPAKVEWAPTLLPMAGYSARFDGILIAAMQTGLLGKFPFIYNGAWSTHLISIHQETVQLGGGGAAASAVVCEFTWTINYAVVTFTDKSKGDIVEWHWSFGDGSYNESQDPRHRYMAIGSYTVTLTVIDSHGKVDTRTHLVNITQMMSTDTIFSHIPVWLLLPIIGLALFALIGTDNRFMRFGCIVALLALVVCMLIGGKLG